MPHHLQQSFIKPSQKTGSPVKHKVETFQSVFQKTVAVSESIKVSKHAEMRLNERGINITPETWKQIQEKVNEASHKGICDSLVVTENAALVVSVKNNTVITAMDREEAQSQLFTNINGAILMN
ncbi:flagellar protein [Bacillus alkalicola]|uniref:Flagellar protein n=2 Tax=Bacillales TaxID=1385 RepID=A0ABS6JP27_9BACI|nr:TIGR02530 family flagellar biosynthesis protein [Bacillus alkalicola]MBU9720324.1 flagellar protein [Bacillus alkalicola]